MYTKCFSTFICYGWAYGCTLTLLYLCRMGPNFGTLGYDWARVTLWCHGWGCKPPLTASHIHTRCIQSVLAPLYAMDGHMGASLHYYSVQQVGTWSKPPRKVSYKHTFGATDQGQTLDVWESQTTESALRWQTCHIAPHHILELTLEVILEVILEHMLGIKTMTSLILDHVSRAYLYLVISTGEKVMILLLSHSLEVVTGQNKT
jgi:hypothetical protein